MQDNVIIEAKQSDGMPDYPLTRPCISLSYLQELVDFLATQNFDMLSYHSLCNEMTADGYAIEFSEWVRQAQKRAVKGLLLHYDVDANPPATMRLVKYHVQKKVPCNVFIFNRKIFDWELRRQNKLEYDDSYHPDFDVLRELQTIGGTVGYHCNAYDRSGGNQEKASEIFREDIKALRKHLDIRVFSMHGGRVDADGMCNARMDVSALMDELHLHWVHNGQSLYFHSNWSDGGVSNPGCRTECSDPVNFITTVQNSERCRLLFHPQYYHAEKEGIFDFPVLPDYAWVKEAQNFTSKKNIWHHRVEKTQAQFKEIAFYFNQKTETERPLFINGIRRSGTALLASIFDCHSKGGMSYESYPRYLMDSSDGSPLCFEDYLYVAEKLINCEENEALNSLSVEPYKNLVTYAATANWSGLTIKQTGEFLLYALGKHHRIDSMDKALEVIAATCRYKTDNASEKFWGTKIPGNYADYASIWPNARFLFVFRNGLDVFTSQKNNGAFNPEAKKLAQNWKGQIENAQKFMDESDAVCACINYEELVSHPRETLQRICRQLEIPFEERLLSHHEYETTLTKNPRGQLSAKAVRDKINSRSIDVWKEQLSEQEVDAFFSQKGVPALYQKLGYKL